MSRPARPREAWVHPRGAASCGAMWAPQEAPWLKVHAVGPRDGIIRALHTVGVTAVLRRKVALLWWWLDRSGSPAETRQRLAELVPEVTRLAAEVAAIADITGDAFARAAVADAHAALDAAAAAQRGHGGEDRDPPGGPRRARHYRRVIPTMGWTSLIAPVDPWKTASPKAKMPPSAATSQ